MAHSRIKKYGDIPNLYIDEVTGYFLIRVYEKGTTRTKSLKTKSLNVAKMKIKSAIKEIVTTDKRSLKNKLVIDYFPGFWRSVLSDDLSEATLKQNDASWRNHIEPFWANVPDTESTHDKFVEFLSWHKKQKGGTTYNALKVLRKLVSYMRKQGAIIPLVDIDVPKRERDKMSEEKGTYISNDEADAIFASKLSNRDYFLIKAAYVMGFRIGELTNLKRDRIKSVDGLLQVHLRAEDTKTRRARTVPLTEELSTILKGILKSHDSRFVFNGAKNKSNPTSKQVVERMWKRTLKDAGIKRSIRFHDLRHTAVTNMAELDLDPVKCCAILGMGLKMYTSTYVKKHKLNLNSIVESLSQRGGRQ